MAFLLLKLATIGIVMASATTALTLPSVRDNSGERSSGKFKSLVVLGDSYSDNCNRWRATSPPDQTKAYPFPSCPPPPLGRASGGQTWGDVVANQTGLALFDYAFGGATCDNALWPRDYEDFAGRTVVLPDVVTQVSQIQKSAKGQYGEKKLDPRTTLVALFIGTNDLGITIDQFQEKGINKSTTVLPRDGESVIDEARCVTSQLTRLYEAGFRSFVVLNTIPLQYTPYWSYDDIQMSNSSAADRLIQPGKLLSGFMQQMVLANNGLQVERFKALENDLKGAKIKIFDTYSHYLPLILDPKNNGYGPEGDSKGFCITCDKDGNCTQCKNPASKVWWDALHPGDTSNKLLGQALAKFIAKW